MRGKPKKISFKEIWQTLKKFYAILHTFRRRFYVGLFVTAVIEGAVLAAEYAFKDIIDAIIFLEGVALQERLLFVVSVFFVINIAGALFRYGKRRLMWRLSIDVELYLFKKIYTKLLHLRLAYYEDKNIGTILRKLNRGTDSIRQLLQNVLWTMYPIMLRLLGGFLVLLVVEFRIALLYLLFIPLFMWVTYRMNSFTYPLESRINSLFEKAYGTISESIYNIKTVKSFVREGHEERAFKRTREQIIETDKENIRYASRYDAYRDTIIIFGVLSVLGVALWRLLLGELTPGEIVLIVGIASYSYNGMNELTRTIDVIVKAQVGVSPVVDILKVHEEEAGGAQPKLSGALTFTNVQFAYKKDVVLKRFSLDIKPGETVAVVGPSGGGKTTLVKMLLRYFDPDKGTVLVDGVDLKKLDVHAYRKQIAVVSQDIDIFNKSVHYNIKFGNAKASHKEVVTAAKQANAHEFIMKLPRQYNTVVGQRGVKLSGGQRQRLGIARAIVADPKVLILDEATSSLDAESERLIQDALQTVTKNRTTIIIAHRLSTIKHADRIVVVDGGRIVEKGTHKQLLAKKGVYANLVRLQVSGYID